jgi:thymidylate synthase
MGFSKTFRDIIEHIESDGIESKPRDMRVKEVVLADFMIDPKYPIADFYERPFNWKYFAGELAWYLHRDRKINYISDYSKFWSKLTNPGTDQINSNYGSLVITDDQFSWVIESLREDINSRQAIMFFNRPEFQFEGNKDFVCTMYANFFIRNNKLNMKIQMRSNDIFFGLTFDAPFFSFLQQSVFLILKKYYPTLELGNYYHYADNLHFYERHFELANAISKTEFKKPYTLILKKPFIEYNEENKSISLSDCARDFTMRMDAAKGREEVNYKSVIQDYFYITEDVRSTENIH